MKRAKYSDIIEWFSLERYDYILDLSVRHVIAEAHMMSYQASIPDYHEIENFKIVPFPFIDDITSWDDELNDKELAYDARGFFPLTFRTLCSFMNLCLEDGRVIISESGKVKPRKDIKDLGIYNQRIRYDDSDKDIDIDVSGIMVHINMDLMDDDELSSSFKMLIKKWREQTGVPEPVNKNQRRFGSSTIAKIYLYKVLPYLDIARWAKINKMSVSNELYARVLFPDPLPNGEIKGGSHIRDSIRPFAESANELLNSISLKKYYSNNPHVGNMRFSDFLNSLEFQ